MPRHLLIIAQSFPPIAGVAAYRPMRLANAMVARGWDVSVMTTAPMDLVYRWGDPSLRGYVDPRVQVFTLPDSQTPYLPRRDWTDKPRRAWSLATRVFKTVLGTASVALNHNDLYSAHRALTAGGAFPPLRMDYRWSVTAAELARQLHATRPISVVLGTMPPHFAGVTARVIASSLGVPYVLDYRDRWVGNPHLSVGERADMLERRLLGRAAVVITTSEGLARDLSEDALGGVTVIPNGFDPRVWAGALTPEAAAVRTTPHTPLRIVHVGTIYESSRPVALIDALTALPAGTASLALYGDIPAEVVDRAHAAAPAVSLHGVVPAAEARAVVATADLGLSFETGAPEQIPAKIFDYVASRTPAIFVGRADHEAAAILARCGLLVGVAESADALKSLLEDAAAKVAAGLPLVTPNDDAIFELSAEGQGARYAELLESAAASAGSSSSASNPR